MSLYNEKLIDKCSSLLQGLCTNDLQKFQSDPTKVSLATAFLDANGRIITDALLNKPHV